MSTWQNSYESLLDFIGTHSSIEINQNVMVIHDDVRPDFYVLFNEVRAQYVREAFAASMPAAVLLATNFKAAKKKALACLNLKGIEVNPELNWFLQDPVDGLARKLFEPLLSLLQGKTDLMAFKSIGSGIIGAALKSFSHRGYLHWATLSLMQLMAPDSLFSVPVPDEIINPYLATADIRPGWYSEQVPEIVPSDVLYLDSSPHTPFVTPKAILQISRMNTFAAIGTDFRPVYFIVDHLSKQMEWFRLEALHGIFGRGDLWPDLAVYLSTSPKELRVMADNENVARPDIIVEVREDGGWAGAGGIETIQRHYDVLRPRLGSFVVCREPVPPETAAGISGDIRLLDVGHDACKLQPIVDAISPAI